MIRPKKRILIILFTIAFIFLIRQIQSQEATLSTVQGGSIKIEYTAETLKDPFQEEMREVKEEPIQTGPLPSLTVQGIVWGGAFPQAIINSKVVKIGDTIEEARIIEISKDGIIVVYGNKKYNLSAPAVTQAENFQKKAEGGTHE
jgi:hypothetical protein